MSDDHRVLIEMARQWHYTPATASGEFLCFGCTKTGRAVTYPCLTARLADALEQALAELAIQGGISASIFRDLVGRESEVADALARAETAERRAAELERRAEKAEKFLQSMENLNQRNCDEALRLRSTGDAAVNVMMLGHHEMVALEQRAARAEAERDGARRVLDAMPLATADECARLERDLAAARAALEKIREATNLALPSEQTGLGWERCVRVPVVQMQVIDAAVTSVLGEPVVTGEPKS